MYQVVFASLCSLLVFSCATSGPVGLDERNTVLAQRELPDGAQATWRLHGSSDDRPQLTRTEVRVRTKSQLGVRTSALDVRAASERGLEPWQGVLLTEVRSGGAAARAGLRTGDVLLQMGGEPLHHEQQLIALLDTAIEPGVPVAVDVRRRAGPGTSATLELDLVPDPQEVKDTVSESVALESSAVVRRWTGLQVAELGATAVAEVTGAEESSRLYVTSVGVGTPAYMAGLRPGDRILSVDGKAQAQLGDLRAAVLSRAQERSFPVASGAEEPRRAQRQAGPLVLAVEGPMGAHATTLDLGANLGAKSSFAVPIVLDYRSSVASTRWSFLDFILQFGANYRSSYQSSSTRAPAKTTSFSMLPFDFFRWERGPGYARYRIFWFIRWENRD